ncbi:DNA-processing protein DprA [Pseudonocardia kujensis]|uniref:DNA-processing protein DprA n=1 Tax=Pseudonocardia kujensis TaxID=1128675 RepID=UPI001E4A4590|nr:DNA-processing protein DprA [Pseudonocardia kujensis]MCE0768187.1 DNA-processing protein DprA [Pseudonocardia kujensis]
MTAAASRPAVVAEEILRARAYLLRVVEPPAPETRRWVELVGPVAAADAVRRGDVPQGVADETSARRGADRVDVDLEAAAACGARLLVPEDPEWPHWPFACFALTGRAELAPPLALWVRGTGSPADLTDRAVALVGARAASGYGTHTAAEFGAGLAEAGQTVVSGAAIGIDGAAHRGALAGGGPTIAVLACGLDRAYPASHAGLLDRIARQGLVVSEYPPGAVPARHRFLVRNRLIAALSAGTVVVEAALRSGAQRTASDARELGTVLMAVPGPVTSATSAGCHELIRQGALLVTRAEEITEATGRLGVELAREPERPQRPTDALDEAQARVHDALPPRAARDIAWLAVEAGLDQDTVRSALIELERGGLAEFHEGRWQRRTRRGSR